MRADEGRPRCREMNRQRVVVVLCAACCCFALVTLSSSLETTVSRSPEDEFDVGADDLPLSADDTGELKDAYQSGSGEEGASSSSDQEEREHLPSRRTRIRTGRRDSEMATRAVTRAVRGRRPVRRRTERRPSRPTPATVNPASPARDPDWRLRTSNATGWRRRGTCCRACLASVSAG